MWSILFECTWETIWQTFQDRNQFQGVQKESVNLRMAFHLKERKYIAIQFQDRFL